MSTAGAAASGPTYGWQSVGSQAALASPKCDPKTGRDRFPSEYVPPCVAPLPAGASNGGATSPGVTATSIKAIVYDDSGTNTTGTQQQQFEQIFRDFANCYSSVYDLYGRRLDLSFVYANSKDEATQRADAIQVMDQHPFFVFADAQTFLDEVGGRGAVTITVSTPVPWKSSQALPGHRWSASMDERTQAVAAFDYIGKKLAGRPVQWAGDATFNGRPRVYGLLAPDTWDLGYITSLAAREGFSIKTVETFDPLDTTGTQEQAATYMSKFRSEGVTSIIDAADFINDITFTKAASAQLYQPEWILTGADYQDVDTFGRLNDQSEWAHAFGIGTVPVVGPDSQAGFVHDYQWCTGHAPANSITASADQQPVWQAALGVQLAGPDLTPATFTQGMFAFPPTGGIYCGCVGSFGVSYGRHLNLGWTDYEAYDDVDEIWWNPSWTGPDEFGIQGKGGYAKANGGRRYLPGSFPTGPPAAFSPAGAVYSWSNVPPNERPPEYPPPAQ